MPTYVRTFQKLHLSGVMHSLMLVPYDVVWIVVEAGGVTNETAFVVATSGLRTIHVGYDHRMPICWDARHKLEARMLLRALRLLWKNLDDKPDWIKDLEVLDGVDEDIDNPLSLLKDTSVVEPLGNCGGQILLWWPTG